MRGYFLILALVAIAQVNGQSRRISFTNRCPMDVWVSPLTAEGPVLTDGIQRLGQGSTHVYQIPDAGWGGRFWPKTGCDSSGQNCEVGQSMDPCLPTGCDPPAETKVEFFFPSSSDTNDVWYDVSLVDGYSLAAEIIPDRSGGACVPTNCAVSLEACPQNDLAVGDLRVIKNGRTVACLAPCKKWNYPPPYGHGRPEHDEPGLWLCCPTPPVDPLACRQNIVVDTAYVELVHRTCPSAYSYSYDDEAGLHNCPTGTNFQVTFCP